jgi:hypothetical protein
LRRTRDAFIANRAVLKSRIKRLGHEKQYQAYATSADQLRHYSSFRKRVAITGPSLQVLIILENQIAIAN